MIIVEVYYDANRYYDGFDAELDEVASKYEATLEYSGMGFGERDIGFGFTDSGDAESFRKEVKGMNGVITTIIRNQ